MIKNSICNEREPAVPYLSKGGASVHFETDRSGEFKGFKLTYEMVRFLARLRIELQHAAT